MRVISQIGRGIANAYNLGITCARAEFVAFSSHDDMWSAGELVKQARVLMGDQRIQYVTGRVKFFVEPGCSLPEGFRKELLDGDHVGHIMETLVARRAPFDRVGLFDCSLTTAEDADWFSRAAPMGIPAAVTPSAVLHKRVHGGNGNAFLNVLENNANLLRVVRSGTSRRRGTPNA